MKQLRDAMKIPEKEQEKIQDAFSTLEKYGFKVIIEPDYNQCYNTTINSKADALLYVQDEELFRANVWGVSRKTWRDFRMHLADGCSCWAKTKKGTQCKNLASSSIEPNQWVDGVSQFCRVHRIK